VPGVARTPVSVAVRAAHGYGHGVLHVERTVSGDPGLAVLTPGGGRVSHSHGVPRTARCRTPGSPWAGRWGRSQPAIRPGPVSLVPPGVAGKGRLA
jgi:hypothetical protein